MKLRAPESCVSANLEGPTGGGTVGRRQGPKRKNPIQLTPGAGVFSDGAYPSGAVALVFGWAIDN